MSLHMPLSPAHLLPSNPFPQGDHESWFETCKDIVITFRMALAEAEAASARAVR